METLKEKDRAKEKQTLLDTLVVSRTFFPKTGGIEEYVYNRCLQEPSKVIILASGCQGDFAFDFKQPFITHRWSMPEWMFRGIIGSLLKQLLNMFWSFVLPIQLYFRYRYSNLEWGHGYDFPSLLLLTYLLPVKFVVYLHGNDVLCPIRNPLLRSWFAFTLNRTDKIVCNSSFTRDFLKANFSVQTPIQVVNPKVRPEKFGLTSLPSNLDSLRSQIRQKYYIPETAIVILTVGRLVRRKGFDRVIKYLPNLISEGIDVHYLICGKGKIDSELKDLAIQLGVDEKVHFAGFVPDRELANYYAACDIFAMLTFLETNEQSIEGFGIVYLEAGYFGKPVIASNVGGVTDAVKHLETGILVDPDAEEEILLVLRELCIDEKLRKRLGNQGKNMVI